MSLNNNYDLDIFNGEEWHVIEKRPSPHAEHLAMTSFPRIMDHKPSQLLLKSVDTGELRGIPVALPLLTTVSFQTAARSSGVYFQRSYASTVHKFQGSECDTVMVINTPDSRDGPELSRRWLYTAVTRARKKLYVVGSQVY